MLDKIYTNLTKKELKQALIIHYALCITSVGVPILLVLLGYFLNGKVYINYFLLIFLLLFIWSVFNIDFLKKKNGRSSK
ncbi:conserved hypothetical protein [Tenacibaculum litopenaei]|uniref:hypothetical protein n=1 Tax=Tenacibaculum litopenaei TaxID=396016 RepID=UPI003896142D